MIEADWLFDDIFGIRLNDSELAPLFSLAHRDPGGRLTEVGGESLAAHLQRLAAAREALIERPPDVGRGLSHSANARALRRLPGLGRPPFVPARV